MSVSTWQRIYPNMSDDRGTRIGLRAWFVRDGLGGDEVGLETGGVGIEQLLDAFGALGLQDEAGVMIFGDTVGDFGIGVGGRIGMFLAGERKNDSGIVAA